MTHDGLDTPWGLVQTPGGLGVFSNALLVGNVGNGRIHGSIGTKQTLVFAAGIDDVTHGLLGTIQPAR